MSPLGSNLGSHDQSDEYALAAEINIIPLVDVLLVLLIVFMIAAPLSISGIKVDLPQSKAKASLQEETRIVLSISPRGEFFLDQDRVSPASLQSKLAGIFQFREKKEMYIRADRSVKFSLVIDAMSAAKMAGVAKIGMLTQVPAQ